MVELPIFVRGHYKEVNYIPYELISQPAGIANKQTKVTERVKIAIKNMRVIKEVA